MMSLALEPEEISFPISGFVTRMLRISKPTTANMATTLARDLRSDLKVAMLHQSLPDAGTDEVQNNHNYRNGNKSSSYCPKVLKDDPLPQEKPDTPTANKPDYGR